MTNMKATKRALGSSVIALFICFAMLLGTTFAWFTDSVTSANNIITAGNLDVELYWTTTPGDDNSWQQVSATTNIFEGVDLWEPGKTEVVYLKVVNDGTLALRYNMNVNIVFEKESINMAGEKLTLSDYIMYGITKYTEEYNTADAAIAAVNNGTVTATKLNAAYISGTETLKKGESATIAMVVYMPETVGNEANHKQGFAVPEIKLGINLFATQATVESDSFSNMYDAESVVSAVGDTGSRIDENKDITLVGVNTPTETLTLPAGYTGKVTLVNSILGSVEAEKDLDLAVYGSVVVKAPVEGKSAITGKTINISGDGNLTAVGNGQAAFGIGGMNTESITIKNVTVQHVAGGCAGEVGPDTKYYKDAPEGGSAIGSGFDGAVITLENVVVKEAIGGSKAAGIGARYHVGATINIVNSVIEYAEGGVTAAGIGGSRVSPTAEEQDVKINITNSTVNAVGGIYGAGVGSGYDTHCLPVQPLCEIYITDSNIVAQGGQYAAGVGTGYHNASLKGEIKNSTVNAKSGAKFYKDTYTQAMDIGFGVVDPSREGQQTGSQIIYNGTAIKIATVVTGSTSDLNGNASIYLKDGNYTLPSVSGGNVSISGTENTVITVNKPNFSGSNITLNGVTVKGSGYSTGIQHVNNVTYNNATIVGEMCLYGEKVVFNNCNFELNGQYIWTYGAKEVEFNNCTFDTTGKAILVYNEGAGASKVTVKNCVFNATAGAKAGAIANQNCAAIEIDNFQSSGTGAAHVVVTEGNTYGDNFSGEWRIKNYVNGNVITVNGVAYSQIAIDGKLMTIDASKNVTVAD